MLDHIILTVSDVERSLKFYASALKPLKTEMFLPYKGAEGHPDLWGFGDGQKAFFWLKAITQRTCLIQMATRLKWFTRVSRGECP